MASVYSRIREEVAPIGEDIINYPEMNKCDRMVKSGAMVTAAESVVGALK